MKRKKLYMAILLFAGILTSCKVGKSYVRPADPDRAHKAGEAVVSAPPVVGAARFSLEDFQTRVRTALKGAPLAPDTAPPLHWDETPPLPVPQPLDEAAVTP